MLPFQGFHICPRKSNPARPAKVPPRASEGVGRRAGGTAAAAGPPSVRRHPSVIEFLSRVFTRPNHSFTLPRTSIFVRCVVGEHLPGPCALKFDPPRGGSSQPAPDRPALLSTSFSNLFPEALRAAGQEQIHFFCKKWVKNGENRQKKLCRKAWQAGGEGSPAEEKKNPLATKE